MGTVVLVSAVVQPRVVLLRGASVGLLTVTLAVGAHGAAGGGVPGPAGVAAVAVAGALLGALTAAAPALRRGTSSLGAVLAAGQVLAHGALSVAMADGHGTAQDGQDSMAGPDVMGPGAMAAGGTGSSGTGSMASMHVGPSMLLTHAVAVLACVVLVRCAERAVPVAAQVLRAVLPALGLLLGAPAPRRRVVRCAPSRIRTPRRRLLLVACAPRRGPPAPLLLAS